MKVTTKKLRVDQLMVIDPAVQRPLDTSWVSRKLKEGFNPAGMGVPAISARPDGSLHIIDGQHRNALAMAAGCGDMQITCQVYEGLTRAEEALLFRVHNDRKSVQPLTKFMVAVIEGDARTVRLNQILNKAGWEVRWNKDTGGFAAVSALYWVCDGGGIRTAGDQYSVVELTIDVITAAWGHDPDGVRAEIVKGVGMVLLQYEGQLSVPTLVKRLAAFEGGPRNLVGKAKGFRDLRGGRVPDAMADVIITLYNKGKRSTALPAWTPGGQVMAA